MNNDIFIPVHSPFFFKRISEEERKKRADEIKRNLIKNGQHTDGNFIKPDIPNNAGQGTDADKLIQVRLSVGTQLSGVINPNGGEGNIDCASMAGAGKSIQEVKRQRQLQSQEFIQEVVRLSRTREGIVTQSAATRQERLFMANHLRKIMASKPGFIDVRKKTHKNTVKDSEEEIPPQTDK